MATSISVLTSLSLSAIATNRRVRGGGDYYLISRSLGAAYGASLGLVLFTAQAVSVAFYCVAFGEVVVALLPREAVAVQAVAGIAAVGVLTLAYLGADLATRFQYVVMAVLVGGLGSFLIGGWQAWEAGLLREGWAAPPRVPFWVLFAIFFPAVTGFTQGVSMSGDLRDPGQSLPRGTLLAVGVSTLVYVAAMFVLAGALPLSELAGGGESLSAVAAVPALVHGGALAATLSSAVASSLGAPRILQALARDRVFGFLAPFAVGHGAKANPRRGVLLTAAIALALTAARDFNAIARLVSMFFLISYGLLNYATYVEASADSPSFRPRFRFFHARASLAGTLLCAGVMLAIDPLASALALAILAALYQYVSRTAVPVEWHDSRRAYHFRRAKQHLGEVAADPETPSDWQPQILVFSEGSERRDRVLRFSAWITGGSGVVTAVQLIEGDPTSPRIAARRDELERELGREVHEHGLDVYPLAIAAPDLRSAGLTLLQSWGLGPIRANTVVLNWLRDGRSESDALRYGRLLASALRLRRNLVILDADETAWVRLAELPNAQRRIDVWWAGEADETCRLELMLAYLTTRNAEWDEAKLRVICPATADTRERREARVKHLLAESRIEADVDMAMDCDAAAVVERSRDAALVFLPLAVEGMHLRTPLDDELPGLLARLPVASLVVAAQDIPLVEEDEPPVEARAAGG
jgi:amino acid transporter